MMPHGRGLLVCRSARGSNAYSVRAEMSSSVFSRPSGLTFLAFLKRLRNTAHASRDAFTSWHWETELRFVRRFAKLFTHVRCDHRPFFSSAHRPLRRWRSACMAGLVGARTRYMPTDTHRMRSCAGQHAQRPLFLVCAFAHALACKRARARACICLASCTPILLLCAHPAEHAAGARAHRCACARVYAGGRLGRWWFRLGLGSGANRSWW